MGTSGWCTVHGTYPTLQGVDFGCPGCNQTRDELARREKADEARRVREAEEAEEQRHRERLAAAEEEREALLAQARATREAIAAADNRQRNAPRLLAEGEVQRARTLMKHGDLESSSRHASRAVEADATYAPGRAIQAKVLHLLGRTAEGLREAEIAFKLAPNLVVNELAEFYPPAAQLMEQRRQEQVRAESLARTEAEQAQKRRELEQRDAIARQVELDRQSAADRQDALTDRWRAEADKTYWRGFGTHLLISLGAALAIHSRMLPHRWISIIVLGGVAPWVSMSVLTALALLHLKIEPSDDEDAQSTDRSVWKWTAGVASGITLCFVVNPFDPSYWGPTSWLSALVVAISVWIIRWQPIRRRVSTSEASPRFDAQ